MNIIKKYVIWSVLLSALIGLSGCGSSSSDVTTDVTTEVTTDITTASDFSMTLDVDEFTVSGDWKTLSTVSGNDTLSASLVTQGKYGTFVVSGDSITYTKTTKTNETDIGIIEITDSTDSVEITVTVHSLYWEQVSEGTSHTAALKSDGTIWSWGDNEYGQLGDGTTNDSAVPVQEFTKATDWIIVSAGGYHTAAIKSDGTLWSWGLNDEGQLGDGTTTNSSVPVQEDTFATDWIDVKAGIGYTVAKKPDGEKRRWGRKNTAPVAEAQSVTTDENTAIRITLIGTDADNDPLIYSIVTGTSNGTLSALSGNKVTYTPDTNYIGVDSFTFKVNDGTVDSDPATVSITVDSVYNSDDVLAQIGLEADNPDVVNSVVTVTQLNIILPALTDLNPANETAYQDYIDANPDLFSSPATQQEVQEMIDAVNAVNNHTPTASDFNLTLDVNESTVIGDWKVLSSANDDDGDTLSASVVTQGDYGAFVVTGDSLAYLKTTETNATDTGVLEITDGDKTVQVTVYLHSLYWKQVSAGIYYSVALKSDGTIWSWGNNYNGQLGNGTKTESYVPVQEFTKATNWIDVDAGGSHTAALKSDGTLWLWGNNNSGELGNNSTTDSSVPVQEFTKGTDWISVSAGGRHTAAIRSNGTLWSWGANSNGQLGDGTMTSSLVPVQEVNGDTDWTSVSAGDGHTVALKLGHTIWSWGLNYSGQLGDGTTTSSPIPVQEVNGDTDWIAVGSGSGHTTALKSNGTLWSWGSNSSGQLGDNNTTDSSIPVQESTLTEDWTSVNAGGAHTIAIKSDSTLWAWGSNYFGQLGDGTITNKLVPTQESTKSTDWSTVSGAYHTLALKSDGTLWSWGRNDYGQLGNGEANFVSVPTQESKAEMNWKSVSTGSGYTVAIKTDGTLWGWGSNSSGKLGNDTVEETFVPIQEATGASDWSSVSAGTHHTVALKTDGTLWGWGWNRYGELGTMTSTYLPTKVDTNMTWSSVSAGYGYTVGLNSDSEIWSMGYNFSGQLGDGTSGIGTDKNVPTKESTAANDWISVSTYYDYTVALKSDGTLWAWGDNSYGVLGDGTNIDSSVPLQESTGATDWSAVSPGLQHTVALKTDGTVWSWGYNLYGRLGDGTFLSSYIPVQEATGADDWSAVSAGGVHTIALKTDGTLWSWGGNEYGQLGVGITTAYSAVPMQESTEANDWNGSTVSSGFHNVSVKTDGTLWAWGLNDYGQVHAWVVDPTLPQPRQP